MNLAYFLLTWKPVRRLAQAPFSPLLADCTLWTTVLITIWCSSSMVAPSSTSSRLSGTSGWTEVAGSDGLLLLEGVRPPRTGTVESGAVSGREPDLEPWGVSSPLLLGSRGLPCGSSRTISSCPEAWRGATLASSAPRGETAGGTEFTSDESREPLDESSSSARGGLHKIRAIPGKPHTKRIS